MKYLTVSVIEIKLQCKENAKKFAAISISNKQTHEQRSTCGF